MKIQTRTDGLTIDLDARDLYLLRRALERASFIDTPAHEQADIASFATRMLEALPREVVGAR